MEVSKQGPVIAIDGPAGTGKSTVTKELARRLNLTHVDTGALYRAIGYLALQKQMTPDQIEKEGFEQAQVADLARKAHVVLKNHEVWINGDDCTQAIRDEKVGTLASKVSAIAEVRSALLGLQRRLGAEGNTILEGRDIGTVVFPDADVKIFLTASIEERANRRLNELRDRSSEDKTFSYEDVKREMLDRDRGDEQRAVAPLKKAEDAIEMDTTQLSQEEVIQEIQEIIQCKIPKRS